MKEQFQKRFNRITYIVTENPKAVAKLLDQQGFEVPDTWRDLVELTKEWVRQDGRKAIMELLKVHPERNAILTANGHSEYDNYGGCGCQSSYSSGGCGCGCQSAYAASPSVQTIMEELGQLTPQELQQRYRELKREVRTNPDDPELKEAMELAWDRLRLLHKPKSETSDLKEDAPEQSKPSKEPTKKAATTGLFQVTKKDVVAGTFILGLALLITRFK